ncbi:MAG TPA: L,D-transpeptidase [Polyangiaceae bacterium]
MPESPCRNYPKSKAYAVARASACAVVLVLAACRERPATGEAAPSAKPASAPAPISTVVVDHGELDTKAPVNAPRLAATTIATTVYKLADTDSRRLGYIRLGGIVQRDPEPVKGKGCKGEWYRVYPMGHVCTDEASVDIEAPLVRAASVRPALDKPLPYKYGFVRATSPQYLRIPTRAEQTRSEFKLDEHIAWFAEHKSEIQAVVRGANDVPLDANGFARPGLSPPPGFKSSLELSENELFGGKTADDPPPFWLQEGRSIPNVSGFEVPASSVFADRVRRKTGLSFVGAFDTTSDGLRRRFAVTVDLRLIPTTKVKPDTGSPFHGVQLGDKAEYPFAWVVTEGAKTYRLIRGKDATRAEGEVPRRAIVPLSGKARIKERARFYQTAKDKTLWLRASDLSVVDRAPSFPEAAEKGEKWIDISLVQQTLVLYEGKKPVYATLVSTGRDRLGDPKESLATPRGVFRIQSKHIAAAMDSEENSTVSGGTRSRPAAMSANAKSTIERLRRAVDKGVKLDEDDRRRLINVEKGRDPEYGITVRRGAAGFELRDVPWIQYFAAGYALHGAYWHDVFGVPRSHGCVNLSPIDARVVFRWTDPPVPEGWHGINVGSDMGQGTTVVIRE